jgi:CDP-6-deoxy-D-xylo-4-hexulose-3-dehydrase
MIKLIKSTFYHESTTKRKVADFILRSKVLSMDSECSKFEQNFAKKQKRKYSLFVSSGSMANLVLLQSLLNLGRIKKGDNVGVSAITWATNVMPIIQLGLNPIVLDCELKNLNISSKILKQTLNRFKLKVLFITNALGFCADLDVIQKMCKKNKIILLEDNCESLGTKLKNKLLGNFGLASTFSSFVGHHFSTIEGGLICTDDKKLFEMMTMVREHGWDRKLPTDIQKKIRKQNKVNDFFARYTFYDLAYNARPTEIQGFIGNLQLQYWNEIVKRREKNFFKLLDVIKSNPDILALEVDHLSLVSNFAVPVICKNKILFNKYLKKFQEANVEVRPIVAGDITQQPFFKKYIKKRYACPQASFINAHGFYFGNNPEMSRGDVSFLCKIIQK